MRGFRRLLQPHVPLRIAVIHEHVPIIQIPHLVQGHHLLPDCPRNRCEIIPVIPVHIVRFRVIHFQKLRVPIIQTAQNKLRVQKYRLRESITSGIRHPHLPSPPSGLPVPLRHAIARQAVTKLSVLSNIAPP